MRKMQLDIVRYAMMLVNFISILFAALCIYVTTEKICAGYQAREFLRTVEALPYRPLVNLYLIVGLYIVILILIVVAGKMAAENPKTTYALMVLEFLLSLVIIFLLDFNYNGILFLVFSGIISYAKGSRGKYMMIGLAFCAMLLTDRDLLGIYNHLYSITDYFNYYSASSRQSLLVVYNLLNLLNMISFIIYCIFLIQEQRGTIEEINLLNAEIKKANEDLQNANTQLEEYAKITEHLGETKERNRLAREIHDTLGHTLTGIAVGLDACITTIEIAPQQTKAQLERISDVARNGLVEIRRSVSELKPDALERLSLESAITKMITDMKSITDMQIFFDCRVKPLKFDEDEEGAIYRVIQESLTNAMRHGHASVVRITIEREDGQVVLTIRDNGVGCAEVKNGFGTKHIQERIRMLNGEVSFAGENGFCVTARIPIRWGEEYD